MKQKEKIREFSRLSRQELQKNLLEKREKLRQLRFDLASGKVKNVREIREIRRDIARTMTILKTKLPKEAKGKKSAKKSFSSFVSSSTRRTKFSSPMKNQNLTEPRRGEGTCLKKDYKG